MLIYPIHSIWLHMVGEMVGVIGGKDDVAVGVAVESIAGVGVTAGVLPGVGVVITTLLMFRTVPSHSILLSN